MSIATQVSPLSPISPQESAGFDVGELSDHELVETMVAARRLASQMQAVELAAVAALARRRFAEAANRGTNGVVEVLSPADYVYDEVAEALTLTATAADGLIRFATELTDRLPATYAALAAGDVDYLKARTMWHATDQVDEELTRTIEAKVLPKAPEQTTGQIRAKIRRLIKRLDPEEADRRREEAEKRRGVELIESEDGTAHLSGVDLPADAASAAYGRVAAIATGLKRFGDVRRIDQLRADVFLGLLRGTFTASEPPADTTDRPASTPAAGTPGWTAVDDAIADIIAETARTELATLTHALDAPHLGPHLAAADVEDLIAGAGARINHSLTDRPATNGPATDPPMADGPVTDAPITDQPMANSLVADWPATDRPVADRPVTDPPMADRSVTDPLMADRSVTDRPITDPPVTDPPVTDPPVTDRPVTDPPVTDRPITDPPVTNRPVADRPVAGRPVAGRFLGTGGLNRRPLTAATRTLGETDCDPELSFARAGARDSGPSTARTSALGERHHDIGYLIAQAGARIEQSLADLRHRWCVPGPARGAVPSVASGAVFNASAGPATTATGNASDRAPGPGPGGGEARFTHGVAGYRPPAAMRRLIEHRDRRCCFPGCRRPVRHCDADHTTPYHRGGATCTCNLAMLCRRHHRAKQTKGWRMEHLWPGVILWITPTGRWRITAPADRE